MARLNWTMTVLAADRCMDGLHRRAEGTRNVAIRRCRVDEDRIEVEDTGREEVRDV